MQQRWVPAGSAARAPVAVARLQVQVQVQAQAQVQVQVQVQVQAQSPMAQEATPLQAGSPAARVPMQARPQALAHPGYAEPQGAPGLLLALRVTATKAATKAAAEAAAPPALQRWPLGSAPAPFRAWPSRRRGSPIGPVWQCPADPAMGLIRHPAPPRPNAQQRPDPQGRWPPRAAGRLGRLDLRQPQSAALAAGYSSCRPRLARVRRYRPGRCPPSTPATSAATAPTANSATASGGCPWAAARRRQTSSKAAKALR